MISTLSSLHLTSVQLVHNDSILHDIIEVHASCLPQSQLARPSSPEHGAIAIAVIIEQSLPSLAVSVPDAWESNHSWTWHFL